MPLDKTALEAAYPSGHPIREGDVVMLSTHAHYAFVERIGDRVLVQFANGTGYDADIKTLSLVARSSDPDLSALPAPSLRRERAARAISKVLYGDEETSGDLCNEIADAVLAEYGKDVP